MTAPLRIKGPDMVDRATRRRARRHFMCCMRNKFQHRNNGICEICLYFVSFEFWILVYICFYNFNLLGEAVQLAIEYRSAEHHTKYEEQKA